MWKYQLQSMAVESAIRKIRKIEVFKKWKLQSMDCNQDYYHSQYRLQPDYDGNMDTMNYSNNYDWYICSVHFHYIFSNPKYMSPFSLPWQKVIWQNFAIWLWQFEKPKPRPQVLRSPILSENCGFYVYFLVKSWGVNVKLINNLPKLIKGYHFFKKR